MNVPTDQPKKRGCLKGCLSAALLSLIVIVGGIWLLLDPNSFLGKPGAISTTCEWTRLIPPPVSNSQIHVETRGGMFTREFILTFSGDADNILSWLKASPSTRATFETTGTPRDAHVEISPGGGAQFAEITISENGTQVVIRAYWS